MFILLQTKDDHGSCIFPRLTQLFFFCVVWYLNGGNPQNIFPDPDTGSPASSLDALTQWNDLPLKPGDVIAHRFKNEWEECYAGSELSVNGVFQLSLMCTCTAVSIPLQFACLLTAFFFACYLSLKLHTGTASNTQNTANFRQSYSKTFVANWYEPSFDDSAWETAWPIPFDSDNWNDDTAAGKVSTR